MASRIKSFAELACLPLVSAEGNRILCRVCGGYIDSSQHYIKRGEEYEHLNSQGPECNRYKNYYGPGKWID